jgi:hypothetical protein
MERQEGYYWVNRRDEFYVAEWIASIVGGWWMLTGNERDFKDYDFEFINENRIKYPGELPE